MRLLLAAVDGDWSSCERDLTIVQRLVGRGAGLSALEGLVADRRVPALAGDRAFLLCDDPAAELTLSTSVVEGQAEVAHRLTVDEPIVLVDARSAGHPFAFAESFSPSCAFIRLPAHSRVATLRHELAHAGLLSGLRLLDEGLADWFAGDDPGPDASDDRPRAPLRGLITTPFTSEIHFESVAPTPEDRRILRARARDLIALLHARAGGEGLRDLFRSIAALRDPEDAIGLIEACLGTTIDDWEKPRQPFDAARLRSLQIRLLRARMDRDLDGLDACAAEGLKLGGQCAGWEALDLGIIATFVAARERLVRGDEVSPAQIAAADAWIAEAKARGLPPGRRAALSGHRASLAVVAGHVAGAHVRTLLAAERAEKAFRQALAHDPEDLDAHAAFAHLLRAKPEGAGGGEAAAAPHLARLVAALAEQEPIPAATPPDAIRIRNLRVAGDEGFELNVEDFHVSQGEKVALVGSNGSGKSTLIDAVLGLVAVKGDCQVLGGPVQTLSFEPVRRQRLGALLNQAPLPRLLKVSEAVRLLDGVFRRSDPFIFEAMGLAELAKKKVGSLSRGQLQRLMIYAAIGHGPDLVILDEASLGLDARYAAALRALIFGEWGQARSMILCSHLEGDLDRVDRVVVLEAGRVKQQGRVAELLDTLDWSWIGQIEGIDLEAGRSAVAALDDFHSVNIVEGRSLSARGGPKFGAAFGLFASAQPYSTYSVSRASIKDVLAGGPRR
ncbi:MAG TPA: ATP-binding cassette domain-containing protein [Allosphingosinicella sp.]|nr:ATP-binding cassette domain-containing protein [Allosphingosinicella sp.]